MNDVDKQKVKKAGFRIFRKHFSEIDHPGCTSIWELNSAGGWNRYLGLSSNGNLDEEWNHLMRDEKNIGD